MEKFTISNMSPNAFNWIAYACAAVFGITGVGLFFEGMTHKTSLHSALGVVLIILAFVLPAVFMGLARTKVEYDGTTIETSSLLKKREIILQDIKRISFEFETCYRSSNNAVCLYVELQDGSDVSLTDTVPKDETDRLVKGDHSSVPLLVMYDAIAEKYPDKVKKN